MTSASRLLGRRLRTAYLMVFALMAAGSMAAGWRIDTLEQQRTLYVEAGLYLLFAALVIVAILEPTIRRLMKKRSHVEAWTAERERLATVAELTHHPVLLTDADGAITWANAACLLEWGVSLDEFRGKPLHDLMDRVGMEPRPRERLRSQELVHWGMVDACPVHVDGAVMAHFYIASDLTDLKASEQTVERQRVMLAATSRVAGVGAWTTDAVTGETTWSDNMFDLFELPVGDVPAAEEQHLHFPEPDRARLREALAVTAREHTPFNLVMRFITAKGRHRWVRVVVECQFDGGKLAALVGAMQDVTRTQEAYDTAEAVNLGHEIRTPLKAVIAMTGRLLDTALTAEQREYAEIAQSSGESLLVLVNDILDIAKIESGSLELESVDFDIRSLIDDTVDAIALQASEKNLELLVEIDARCPRSVTGDPTRLRQVLLNLMINAVRFTDTGDVTLAVKCPSQDMSRSVPLTFSVSDSGWGMAAEGTGLGLSICRRLVQAMGGDLILDSTVGKGSTYAFGLSLGACAPMDARVDRSVAGLKRALVVDDHPVNVRILTAQLRGCGLDVRNATAASEGLQRFMEMTAAGENPDVVVLDQHMPDHDGIWLARAMQAHARAQRCVYILLSSLALEVGPAERRLFDRIVTKPVKNEALYRVLHELSGRIDA